MKLKELADWLIDLQDLIVDINICVSNGQRIPSTIYPNEDKLKQFGFFSYYQFHLSFIVGIQLSKILSDSDGHRRNIHKLFARLESESYDSKLKNRIRINNNDEIGRIQLMNDIAGFRKLISNKKKLIDRVIEVRDKAFAHHDPKRNKFGHHSQNIKNY